MIHVIFQLLAAMKLHFVNGVGFSFCRWLQKLIVHGWHANVIYRFTD
jgi:hypothetical protein